MSLRRIKVAILESGKNVGEFVFDRSQICTIGRAPDCEIQIVEADGRRQVSRHHCRLEIDPPNIRVRDLHSTNGTYVNGRRLLRDPTSTDPFAVPVAELRDGDEVQMGPAVLKVSVQDTA